MRREPKPQLARIFLVIWSAVWFVVWMAMMMQAFRPHDRPIPPAMLWRQNGALFCWLAGAFALRALGRRD